MKFLKSLTVLLSMAAIMVFFVNEAQAKIDIIIKGKCTDCNFFEGDEGFVVEVTCTGTEGTCVEVSSDEATIHCEGCGAELTSGGGVPSSLPPVSVPAPVPVKRDIQHFSFTDQAIVNTGNATRCVFEGCVILN